MKHITETSRWKYWEKKVKENKEKKKKDTPDYIWNEKNCGMLNI